ncbi:LysR family transcriptional regulator [Nocardia sp. NPDC088792]|uniref:LysR family transcriptional regulator n=1 Tax=Nocardia sp. NPDC088792 TaxID=3364332 RepID=UPI0038111A7B
MDVRTDLDLAAVRAFVAAVDEGQFGFAGDLLEISQQAVSKRIAKLETHLGTALFERLPGGIALTAAGRRLLPHARSLLAIAEEAAVAVRGDAGPLRVAVLGERDVAMQSMRFYLDRSPGAEIDIVLSNAFDTSRDALMSGRADAAFARNHGGPRRLPGHIAAVPAYLEPLHLVVGRDHPLSGRSAVSVGELRAFTVWVPGARVPSEWADFYRDLNAHTGITIDTDKRRADDAPSGVEAMFDRIAGSPTLATFSGEGFHNPWHPHVRRVPIVDPTPAYPHALLWDSTNTHPGLPGLISHVRGNYNSDVARDCWFPEADRALFL